MRRSMPFGASLLTAVLAVVAASVPIVPAHAQPPAPVNAQVIATWSSPGEAAERYRFSLQNFRNASSYHGEDYRQATWPADGVELVAKLSPDAARSCHREAARALSSLAQELNLNLRLRFAVAERPSRAAVVLHFSEERLASLEAAPRFRERKVHFLEDHRTSCEQSSLLHSEAPREIVHGYLWRKSSCVCPRVPAGNDYASLLAEARLGVARLLIVAAGLDPLALPDQSFSREIRGKALFAFYAYLEHLGAIESGLHDRAFRDRISVPFGAIRN
jgi:hypothetical protein